MAASKPGDRDDKLSVAQSPLIVPADLDAAPIKQLAATNATDEQQGDFTGPRDGMVWVSSSRSCDQASERRTHHAKLTMGSHSSFSELSQQFRPKKCKN